MEPLEGFALERELPLAPSKSLSFQVYMGQLQGRKQFRCLDVFVVAVLPVFAVCYFDIRSHYVNLASLELTEILQVLLLEC